jgi:DNA-binding transcriptional LysR family regulator
VVFSAWDFVAGQDRLCAMNLDGFKVFCDLCDTGSFSRAAEASGITQSAVSQQIRAVEKRFGVPLVDRADGHFTLTPEGRVYLEVCRDILARWDSLGSRFRVARGKLGGKLRVASVISIALHDLPPLLKQFRRNHPGVEVTVDYRKAEEIYAAVEDGRADLGLVAYPRARPGLRAITCWQERLVLVMPPGHPLRGKRALPLRELEGHRFVALSPDIPTRQHLDKTLRQAGVRVTLVAEVENIETVKAAVGAEQAISIIPETSVRQETRQGILVTRAIDAERLWRPMGAVTRRPIPDKPSLLEFLGLLTPRARALIPAA